MKIDKFEDIEAWNVQENSFRGFIHISETIRTMGSKIKSKGLRFQ